MKEIIIDVEIRFNDIITIYSTATAIVIDSMIVLMYNAVEM